TLWNVKAGKELYSLKAPASVLTFSPDGGLLAIGQITGVRLLDVRTGKDARRLEGSVSSPRGLAFSADSTMLAIAEGTPGNRPPAFIHIYDVASGKGIRQI